MDKPKITWLTSLSSDDEYIERPELYAGSFQSSNSIEIDFQVWNNQYGIEEVQSLEDFSIVASFDHLEDSALLKYMRLLVNHAYIIEPVVNNNEAVFKIPSSVSLSGAINDGDSKSYGNYMSVRLALDIPEGEKVKTNDLKTINLDIVKL